MLQALKITAMRGTQDQVRQSSGLRGVCCCIDHGETMEVFRAEDEYVTAWL